MMSEESGVVCTGEVKAFRESRKKQFDRKCECDKWDFLAGVGPSAIRREVRTISCCLTFPWELRLRYARPPPAAALVSVHDHRHTKYYYYCLNWNKRRRARSRVSYIHADDCFEIQYYVWATMTLITVTIVLIYIHTPLRRLCASIAIA